MNDKKKNTSLENVQIDLFATAAGVQTIDSPVKLKILSVLREHEQSFDEIVKLTGKAKSTVSAHLKTMVQNGIIGSKIDPEDARKKIFYIKSEYIGKLYREKLQDDINCYIERYIDSENDPFEFFRLIFLTIRVSLLTQGIDVDPILQEAGIRVGEVLYDKVADPSLDKFLANISKFWKTHSLGTIELKSAEPLAINVYDCFECSGLPYLGRPACAFDSGILKTLFKAHYNHETTVKETECYAMGNKNCSFLINRI